MNMMNEKTKFPFTNNQWEELEHQALIFKYMISGMQIPPDLLLSVKRSMVHLSLSSRFHPHPSQQYDGWNCLQMGLGGRKIDPEPGRCRRTDGKKWRCSKEAYNDSKYCERHMHRGKNRSRKPVEINHNSSIYKNPMPSSIYSSGNNASVITSPPSSSISNQKQHPCYSSSNGNNQYHHPFYYQNSSSSSRDLSGIGGGLSSQNYTTHLFLDSNSYARDEADYRDRYLAPLTMSSKASLSHSKQRDCSETQSDYSCYLKLQSLTEREGFGFSPKNEREDDEPRKTTHHFFDERPLKNKDSWLNLDDNSSNCSSLSTTQLSISVPTSSQVFPIFSSRTRNDG